MWTDSTFLCAAVATALEHTAADGLAGTSPSSPPFFLPFFSIFLSSLPSVLLSSSTSARLHVLLPIVRPPSLSSPSPPPLLFSVPLTHTACSVQALLYVGPDEVGG